MFRKTRVFDYPIVKITIVVCIISKVMTIIIKDVLLINSIRKRNVCLMLPDFRRLDY